MTAVWFLVGSGGLMLNVQKDTGWEYVDNSAAGFQGRVTCKFPTAGETVQLRQ